MPKIVQLTNLNPHSAYPICRFQVVNHTTGNEAHNHTTDLLDSSNHKQQKEYKYTDDEKYYTDLKVQNVYESIESMHQKATELLRKMSERRDVRRNKQFRQYLSTKSLYRKSDSVCGTMTKMDVDSGGNVHGPMDQHYSSKLGNISRSGHLIPGSRHYFTENWSSERMRRRQSDSGQWDFRLANIHNLSNFCRGRTNSESRRTEYLNEYNRSKAYDTKSMASTRYQYAPHPSSISPTRISRWASMQTTDIGRRNYGSRYATTLTRQHIKRHRDPVEMIVKHTPSVGASRVDLVSVENRQGSMPHLNYTQMSEREQRLQNELYNTQRELQQLKRSRSLTGDHALDVKHNLHPGSSQYLNECGWTTYSLKKNEGQPCGAKISTQPYRATSQTNIHRSPQVKTQWISESNLQNSSSTMKHPTMHSTYSAHKENQRRMEEQRRATEDWHASTKHMHDTRSIGSRAVLEEMETITLQPIGRGVHDLEPTTGSISRSYRANTPTANRTYGSGWDQHDAGPRPMNAMNYHRETHTPRSQSPHIGPHKFNSQYEATSVLGSEVRHRSVNMNSDSQYRTTTSVNGHGQYHSPFSGVDSFGGTSGIGDNVDGESGTMHHVLDTSKYWYLPGVSRPDVIAMLRDKPAGSFVIRNSNTYADSFGLALKISPNTPKMMSTKDDSPNDLVRHFLIGTVPMQDGRGNGVHLRGFSSDPTFPSLSAFVHYHMHKQGALPCLLRLPTRTTLNDQMNFGMDNTILSSLPGGGVAADMLYLGSVEVDRMDNLNAAVHAVSNILTQISTNPNGLAKQCEVLMKVIPQDGITFIDRNRRRVLNKYIKSNNIIWCGMDPENREYHESEVRNRGVYNLRIFVIIARKQRLWLHENVAYVFSELDPTQSAINLVRYINSVFFA